VSHSKTVCVCVSLQNGLSAIDMIPKSPEAMSKLLWIACMRGDTKATAELIERGADINAFDPVRGIMVRGRRVL